VEIERRVCRLWRKDLSLIGAQKITYSREEEGAKYRPRRVAGMGLKTERGERRDEVRRDEIKKKTK